MEYGILKTWILRVAILGRVLVESFKIQPPLIGGGCHKLCSVEPVVGSFFGD